MRRSDDMGNGVCIVVIKRVGRQIELGRLHLHVVVEYRHLGLCIVFTPVRGQCGLPVDHFSAFEEISVVVKAVEVERVGIEGRLAVLQHHIIACPGHLLVAVVVSIVRHQREGVALVHPHMTESLERVAGLIEIGTVAV